MSDSDTLLVFSAEYGSDQHSKNNWLVATSRDGSEWHEAQRLQTVKFGFISCAMSDSRVLIGKWNPPHMKLFREQSGPRIVRLYHIHVPERYEWFSAMCGSDTLVAMCYFGARASTARRPAGRTRAHSVEVLQ